MPARMHSRPVLAALVAAGLAGAAGLPGHAAAAAEAGGTGSAPLVNALDWLPDPDGRASGLVLGLRHGNAYRTLYLVQGQDGLLSVAADLPVLVTPQRDGFWVLGAESVTSGPGCPGPDCAYSLTEVWIGRTVPDRAAFRQELARELASHVEHDPQFPTASYHSHRQVDFVANGTVCVHLTQDGYAAGAAHPFAEDRAHCVRMPPNRGWDRAPPMPLADTLVRDSVVVALRNGLIQQAAAGRYEGLRLGPDDRQMVSGLEDITVYFRLGRHLGYTLLTGITYGEAPYVLSNTYSVTVVTGGLAAPPPLAPYNPDHARLFDQLRALDPAINDMFVAPTNAAAFLLAGDRLIGIDRVSRREQLVLTVPHDAVVVAEWAVGAHVQNWAEDIRTLAR